VIHAIHTAAAPFQYDPASAFSTNALRSAKRDRIWAAEALLGLLDVVVWITVFWSVLALRGIAIAWAYSVTSCLVQLAAVIVALIISGGYSRHTNMRSLAYMAEHLLAMIGAALAGFFIIYSLTAFDQQMKPSRGVLLASIALFAPLSLAYRRAVDRLISRVTAQKAFLVIGSSALAAQFFAEYRQASNRQRLEFVSLDPRRVGEHIAGPGSPIIESDLATKLTRLNQTYSGVILAEPVSRLPQSLVVALVRVQFQATRVYTLESFYEAHWRYVPLDAIDPVWPLQTGFQLARTSPYAYLKRVLDIVVAGSLLILAGPIIVAIGVLIWWRDGKPALFRQPRVGRNGEVFTILKFRTMRHQAPDGQEDIYTREGDPRVTEVGRWLRKLRLDELPQLWNVLRGEMSLIGPRAEWTKCAEQYERAIPFYHFRHLVQPGITGWAQVNYPYGENAEDAVEKLKYDLYYIRRYSLKLDAMIMIKTIHTMLFGAGQ
jgi:exopolysaccharide biosynthesis polyprenyl glycosylphosphotransferase